MTGLLLQSLFPGMPVLRCGSLAFPPSLPGAVCTVRRLRRTEPDAAFSLCHTHSAITLVPGGERKEEGSRTLKRDLELERGLLSGLEFNFVGGSVLILFFSSRIKNYQ